MARVLVIDDDANVRTLVCDLLGRLQCQVDEAEDGPTALRLLPQRRYDLIVTDLMMPGVSGWEVVDAVRARVPTMPFVMITGFATEADEARAQAAGLTLLRKPISVADFTRAITHALTPAPAMADDPTGVLLGPLEQVDRVRRLLVVGGEEFFLAAHVAVDAAEGERLVVIFRESRGERVVIEVRRQLLP